MASETMHSQSIPDVASPIETEERQREMPTSAAGQSTGVETDSLSPQQAPVPSDKGKEVPADQTKKPSEINRYDSTNVVELPPRSPTFKEQVYGYARLIRGTVLGKPSVKEQGTQVLRGEQSIALRRGSQSSK